MMEIVNVRIDDRLIHGQVAAVWSLATKATRIMVVDDLVVKAPAAMKVAFGENPKVNYSGQGKSPSTRMAIAKGLWRRSFFIAGIFSG